MPKYLAAITRRRCRPLVLHGNRSIERRPAVGNAGIGDID